MHTAPRSVQDAQHDALIAKSRMMPNLSLEGISHGTHISTAESGAVTRPSPEILPWIDPGRKGSDILVPEFWPSRPVDQKQHLGDSSAAKKSTDPSRQKGSQMPLVEGLLGTLIARSRRDADVEQCEEEVGLREQDFIICLEAEGLLFPEDAEKAAGALIGRRFGRGEAKKTFSAVSHGNGAVYGKDLHILAEATVLQFGH